MVTINGIIYNYPTNQLSSGLVYNLKNMSYLS